MTKRPAGDRTKLPVWAQRDFERLEKYLAEANDEISELHRALGDGTPADDATIFLADTSWNNDPQPLPKYSRIKFKLGDHWVEAKVIRSRRNQPVLELMTSHGPIVMGSWSSNVLHVWEGDR